MSRYITNPQAIHETIDGETIIINLTTGTYYSLRGAAPTIWNAICEGASTAGLVQQVESSFETGSDEIAPSVEAFLLELQAEDLVAVTDANGSDLVVAVEPAAERTPFEAPHLEKYTDMQDIILLDPVHKVDSEGWPQAAPAQTT
jgi:Coenzyme PQQ synthesis protein D (PqqD)